MYYTSKSIKLINRYASYLELIQKANDRYIDKFITNSIFDEKKERSPYSYIWEPMNYKFNAQYMERMKALSTWLVIRMQSVITELNEANIAQLRKELSTNEVNTIEL